MARAAVKAKQAKQAQHAHAQAQAPAKPSRKQRTHAPGGNPNQDLFFSRLRRKQKWVFFGLAIVFTVSFVFIGVGSGNNVDLGQIFSSIVGNGNDPVAKAQAEIDKGNLKAYKDLANAYVTKNDIPSAVTALEDYLKDEKGKKDPTAWAQLGGLTKQQGDVYVEEYRRVQLAAQFEAPGTLFQPTGALAGKLGTNPIDDYYTKRNDALLAPLYRNATTYYSRSLGSFQRAAKYSSPADRPNAELAVYSAAQLAGKPKAALTALQAFVELDPTSPNIKQIEAACKQLGGSCPAKPAK